MAKVCNICGKRPLSMIKRSHSKIATKAKQNVNLQSKVVDGKRVNICTRCLRTLSKKDD